MSGLAESVELAGTLRSFARGTRGGACAIGQEVKRILADSAAVGNSVAIEPGALVAIVDGVRTEARTCRGGRCVFAATNDAS